MPTLDTSQLNIVIAILGAFMILYGLISVKLKNAWYLGEALPAVVMGVLLGPISATLLDSTKWGSAVKGQKEEITLGLMRVMIGIQLVIAGYQLPAKFLKTRYKEMLICLLPIMTLMWIATSACVLATIPNISILATLVIGACFTSTDPILSQAVAKGPFADKYVARPLREIISAEAGANDGFAFPFLMLAIHLMRHAEVETPPKPTDQAAAAAATAGMDIHKRAGTVGRLGGGVGKALQEWGIETLLYIVLMAMAYGWVCGYLARRAIKISLRRKWVDSESYLLYPTAIGLFIIGTAGSIGTSDLLACFVAGCALNWDGRFLAETLQRHDEVNSCIDVLLNFGGFMYIGIVLPWSEFHQPDTTGITIGRLIGLGFLVLIFRRIPALMALYKCMPGAVKTWKEALFMGYFGPIGVGAVFYLEHTRHLFPKPEAADPGEKALLAALGPTVYFLVLFSIVVHGLSIPLLSYLYPRMGVKPVQDDAVEVKRRSMWAPAPSNAVQGDRDTYIAFNRFSRPVFNAAALPAVRDGLEKGEVQEGDFNDFMEEKKRAQQEFQTQRKSAGPGKTMATKWV